MRVKLSSENLQKLFTSLNSSGYSIAKISLLLTYHERTIRDWRRGKYLMDDKSYNTLTKLLKVDKSLYSPNYVDVSEQRRVAGRKGGNELWLRRGKIGTLEDKIKGGKHSFEARKNKNDIFSRQKIIEPCASSDLAEFIGICMGDGSVTDYQLVISFNRFDDAEYVSIVRQMISRLFGLTPSVQERKDSKCTNLIVSSIAMVEYLQSLGLPKGDKLRAGLDIPEWIKNNQEYSTSCTRGLMDTDGSIFQEIHKVRDRIYAYPRLSFVSASVNLRNSVKCILDEVDIASKIRMDRSVNIERFTDIQKYFRIVGSSNPKHLRRFAEFGEVA